MPNPISSQRHRFDIPADVAYLNCAYMSPLMDTVVAAGTAGVRAKAQPWLLSPPDFFSTSERLRALFARIVNARADDIAIVPAASYGIATAARNLKVETDREILFLEDQFPSNVYAWRGLAANAGARAHMIARAEAGGGNGPCDWTTALLETISDRTAIVALPHCHWTDGALIDLEAVGRKARAHGARLVLDVTQSCGALPIDVATVKPDFLVAATYKWLLGPYSYGFLYVAPEHHDAQPLEENWICRKGSEDFRKLVDYQDDYQPGARRFDMGERSSFHLAPMAQAALSQILDWGIDNIAATLAAKTAAIAARAAKIGLEPLPENMRAPHYLGLRVPGGVPEQLPARLAEEKVYVSVRGDSIRVTPHVYNEPGDTDRLIDVIGRIL